MEKSAISEHFIEASREKMQAMMEGQLDNLRLCVFADRCDAVRRPADGCRIGNRPGRAKNDLRHSARATENATVVGELLGDLASRGLDFTEPRLYVLDGGKALTAAVRKHAGNGSDSVVPGPHRGPKPGGGMSPAG